MTTPKPQRELEGLVYSLTPLPAMGEVRFYKKPVLWAGVLGIAFIILNIIFW